MAFSVLMCAVLSYLNRHNAFQFYSDSCEYITGGLSLFSGKGYLNTTGEAQTMFPPGYPIAIGLAAKLLKDSILAARIVSFTASALTVVPLYLIARRLFGQFAAGLTVVLYAFLPLRISLSNLVLTEALFVLLQTSAFQLWLMETDEHSIKRSVVMGAFLGYSYLVRPEGLITAAVLLSLSLICRQKWPTPKRSSVAVVAIVLILFVVPYAMYLHAHTGKWTISNKGKFNIHKGMVLSYSKTWEETSKLNADATEIVPTVERESKADFVKRYSLNAFKEARLVYVNLGIILCLGLAAGFIKMVTSDRDILWKTTPMFLFMCVQIFYIPAMFVMSRFIYTAILAFIMVSSWSIGKIIARTVYRKNRTLSVLITIGMAAAVITGFVGDYNDRIVDRTFDYSKPLGKWLQGKVSHTEMVISGAPTNNFYSGHRWLALPCMETTDRVVKYAQNHQVRYILLYDGQKMSDELVALARKQKTHPSMKYIDGWEYKDGTKAALYKVH